MKKVIGLFLTIILIISLSACAAENGESSSTDNNTTSQSTTTNANESEKTDTVTDQTENEIKILVVCFSATGNTETVAEKIVEVTGADYYEIIPEQAYSEDDLNYSDDDCRANREQQDENARPSITGGIENIDVHEVVLIGHPIWWGIEPRIVDTFMESYDFSGKTLVNFCTSGGSGISTSTENLKALSPNANWLEGKRFSNNADIDEIEQWIDSLGIQ